MIQHERVRTLNSKSIRQGRYVLYRMQASVRTEYNHALVYAIREANELNQPLLVFFGIAETFPRPMRGTTTLCWRDCGRPSWLSRRGVYSW